MLVSVVHMRKGMTCLRCNPDNASHVCYGSAFCCKMLLLALRISKQLEVAKLRR